MKYEYEVKYEHNLELDVARNRLENLAEDLERNYGDQVDTFEAKWSSPTQYDFSLKAMLGVELTGGITLEDSLVTVAYGHNSFMISRFSGNVERRILARLEKWFGEE